MAAAKKNTQPEGQLTFDSLDDSSVQASPDQPGAKRVKKAAAGKKNTAVKKAAKKTSKKSKKKTTKKSANKTAKKAVKKTLIKTAENPEKESVQKPAQKPAGIQSEGESTDLSRILVIAGEHSGDLLGAALIARMKKYGTTHVLATGGSHMEQQGAELVEHIENMDVIGFVEALKAYRRLKKLARRITAMCEERNIHLAVLIDYPGFNLRIAEMLKEKGIRIVYLVSPQIWAWNYGRIEKIKKNVDLMLPLFEFESRMYQKEGVEAVAVGHPMVSEIEQRMKNSTELPESVLKGKPLIGILPGSRVSEIERLLEPMCEAALLLKKDHPRAGFLLPNINMKAEPYIQKTLEKYSELKIEYLSGQSLQVMQACDLVMIASGTATVETAFFRKPMVILYKLGWINFLISALLLRTRVIGLANLLSKDGPVGVELLQTEVTPENIRKEVNRILADRSYRQSVEQRLETVRQSLGDGKPAQKAARLIAKKFLSAKAV